MLIQPSPAVAMWSGTSPSARTKCLKATAHEPRRGASTICLGNPWIGGGRHSQDGRQQGLPHSQRELIRNCVLRVAPPVTCCRKTRPRRFVVAYTWLRWLTRSRTTRAGVFICSSSVSSCSRPNWYDRRGSLRRARSAFEMCGQILTVRSDAEDRAGPLIGLRNPRNLRELPNPRNL